VHAVGRPGLGALLAEARHALDSSPADRPARLIALGALALCLVAGAITAARWIDGGVDGILSQLPVATGFEVRQVRPGGAADSAGMRPGDVIVMRDGRPATEQEAYWAARGAGHAGDAVVLSVRSPGAAAPQEHRLTLTPNLGIPDQVGLLVILLLVQILIPVAGTIVLLARPRDPAARLFFVAGLSITVANTLFLWDKAAGTTVDPVWTVYGFYLARLFSGLAYIHLLLLFPAVHPWVVFPKRMGWQALRWSLAMAVIYVLPLGVDLYILAEMFPGIDLGALVAGRPEAVARINEIGIPISLGMVIALAYGYRRAKSVAARAAVWWLLFAIAFRSVVNLWGTQSVAAVTGGHFEPLAQWFVMFAPLLVYGGIAVALVRYRLFEVSPIVRRAIVYPLAIALLVGAYDLMAPAIARGLTELLGAEVAHSPVIQGLPVLIVVALLRPVRKRLQALLERRLDRPRWAVESFAADAEATFAGTSGMSTETLLTTYATERLGLSGAWLMDATDALPPRTDPVSPEEASARFPLVVPVPDKGDRAVGMWVLGPRVNGDPFDDAELGVLARVARLASRVLDYQRLLAQISSAGALPVA